MTLRQYISRASQLPPHILLSKTWQLGRRYIQQKWRQQKTINTCTFTEHPDLEKKKFAQILTPPDLNSIIECIPQLNQLIENYLSHKFDLLGSGWVHIPPPPSTDQVTSANLAYSKKVWQNIDTNYTPIDWQLDFKSGFRWSAQTFFANIQYGHKPGVDIKVPWELARMQHLPHLAYGDLLAHAGLWPKDLGEKCVTEIRNQILDFIATNPPLYGVNWKCPMDVAIRAANWLIAIDFVQHHGFQFDQTFQKIVMNSLWDHGQFIYQNLERATDFRGNHYLADIAGLTYIAAYLPVSAETTNWLRFCHHELINECDFQFNQEGSNFEGSTSYHRLSSEMLLYASLVLRCLPKEKKSLLIANSEKKTLFPEEYNQRIKAMGDFSWALMKNNFQIPQFGDCDSGRFVKFHPEFLKMDNKPTLDEDHLDHRGLVAATLGFNSLAPLENYTSLEYQLIKNSLQRTDTTPPKDVPKNKKVQKLSEKELNALKTQLRSLPSEKSQSFIFSDSCIDPQSIQLFSFSEFGVFIYKSSDFYLAVRCGPVGQMQRGGHDHNDQLSIELRLGQHDVIIDPGTYLYTPHPELRNQYRSVKAHFTPQLPDREPGQLDQGLFFIGKAHSGTALMAHDNYFLGMHKAYGAGIYREIKIAEGKVEINDYFTGNAPLRQLDANQPSSLPYSRGYGFTND